MILQAALAQDDRRLQPAGKGYAGGLLPVTADPGDRCFAAAVIMQDLVDIDKHALAGPAAGAGPGRIKPAWVALVEILARMESEPYHWPVGRTTFQKIAYFATEADIPTGLTYSRGSFGPYAPDLKTRITQLVNNGLVREERLGQMFAVKVGPTFNDARKSYRVDIERLEPIIERVADLFLRMKTKQAEVAATVHFATKMLTKTSHEKPSETQVLASVMQWKQKRRPPLDESEVAKTIRSLAALGWLNVRPSTDLPLPEEATLNV